MQQNRDARITAIRELAATKKEAVREQHEQRKQERQKRKSE